MPVSGVGPVWNGHKSTQRLTTHEFLTGVRTSRRKSSTKLRRVGQRQYRG